MVTEHQPHSQPVSRAPPDVVPGAVCNGTYGGEVIQVCKATLSDTPGSLVLSRGGPSV